MAIHFFLQKFILLKDKRRLKIFIKKMIEKENHLAGNLSFIFCTDTFLLDINKRFLKHNDYTDVITFNYLETESKKISGEVYISTDRVEENAQKFKISFDNELHRVMIHGILHLLGYQDNTKTKKKIMREKEDLYLLLYSESI